MIRGSGHPVMLMHAFSSKVGGGGGWPKITGLK